MFSKVLISLAVAGLISAVAPSGVLATDSFPVFDGQKAMQLLIQQCEMGPRTPGSAGNRELRTLIMDRARASGLKVTTHCFEATLSLGESPVELCNVLVTAGGQEGDGLWLGAHYDTRPVCDRDADAAEREQPLTGANDGASGVAVLLHLMELMAENPPARPVHLIFFDGEDSGVSGSPVSYCVGSQRLAATLDDFDNPLNGLSVEGLVLLDMIGDANLFIPMEAYSHTNAPAFTTKVFDRALKLGLPAFSPSVGPAVYDDHVPFLQRGIPAVDLIDFDYPQWHTSHDTPDACSAASLEQVGLLMVDLIYNP